jgi:hypothetical protein
MEGRRKRRMEWRRKRWRRTQEWEQQRTKKEGRVLGL